MTYFGRCDPPEGSAISSYYPRRGYPPPSNHGHTMGDETKIKRRKAVFAESHNPYTVFRQLGTGRVVTWSVKVDDQTRRAEFVFPACLRFKVFDFALVFDVGFQATFSTQITWDNDTVSSRDLVGRMESPAVFDMCFIFDPAMANVVGLANSDWDFEHTWTYTAGPAVFLDHYIKKFTVGNLPQQVVNHDVVLYVFEHGLFY
jgi:hypothetical protein